MRSQRTVLLSSFNAGDNIARRCVPIRSITCDFVSKCEYPVKTSFLHSNQRFSSIPDEPWETWTHLKLQLYLAASVIPTLSRLRLLRTHPAAHVIDAEEYAYTVPNWLICGASKSWKQFPQIICTYIYTLPMEELCFKVWCNIA